MKKILFVLACLAVTIGLCSCESPFSKPEPTPVPEIDPAALVTIDDVVDIAGYTPVIDNAERAGNMASVMYRSEPIGQSDTVTVTVTQFNDTIGYEQIYAEYEQGKAARPSAELVESLGQETYIAFPTIHVYDRGCLIEITAGSGSDEVQKNQLKGFAVRAATRLEEIIPEYTG